MSASYPYLSTAFATLLLATACGIAFTRRKLLPDRPARITNRFVILIGLSVLLYGIEESRETIPLMLLSLVFMSIALTSSLAVYLKPETNRLLHASYVIGAPLAAACISLVIYPPDSSTLHYGSNQEELLPIAFQPWAGAVGTFVVLTAGVSICHALQAFARRRYARPYIEIFVLTSLVILASYDLYRNTLLNSPSFASIIGFSLAASTSLLRNGFQIYSELQRLQSSDANYRASRLSDQQSHLLKAFLTREGEIANCNPSFRHVANRGRQFVEGQKIWRRHVLSISDEASERLRAGFRKCRKTGAARLQFPYANSKEQIKWLDATFKQLAAPRSTGIRVSFEAHDVTAEKLNFVRYQESLKTAKSEERIKNDFMAVVSHELRTPLNPIIGFSTVLLQDEELNPIHREQVEAIQKGGAILHKTIEEIFELTLLESEQVSPELAPTDLFSLLRQAKGKALADIRKSQKDIAVSHSIQSEIKSHIKTDGRRVSQILSILLENAVKFTESGNIDIRAKSLSANTLLAIEIRDTGLGIPGEKLDSIFEPFRQGDMSNSRKHGGLGLGLPIAKRLAKILGGDLDARSDSDGSKFTLTLPYHPYHQSRDLRLTRRKRKPSQQKAILVVEDDEYNLGFLRKLLISRNFQVFTAFNGRQATEVIQESYEQIDIILMDIHMPVMDGIEATQRIRAMEIEFLSDRSIPIIAFTATAHPDDKERCLRSGCDDYLNKPVTAKELQTKIERHLANTQPSHRNAFRGEGNSL
ncbi:MAG: response regulator [Verrucomicrobiota bacterium]